ncbi:MAG: hypothetical protein ACFFD2_14665 [Promethearchaeota archaeon]
MIIVLATETEFDDAILMPILSGLTNFGLIGTIGSLISKNLVLTSIIAVISGVITSISIYYIKNSLESKPTDYKIFEGKEATVEIPFTEMEIGQVSIELKSGEREEFPARAFDPNAPPYMKGDKVTIKKYDGGIAEIVKSVNWEIKKLKKEKNNKE